MAEAPHDPDRERIAALEIMRDEILAERDAAVAEVQRLRAALRDVRGRISQMGAMSLRTAADRMTMRTRAVNAIVEVSAALRHGDGDGDGDAMERRSVGTANVPHLESPDGNDARRRAKSAWENWTEEDVRDELRSVEEMLAERWATGPSDGERSD